MAIRIFFVIACLCVWSCSSQKSAFDSGMDDGEAENDDGGEDGDVNEDGSDLDSDAGNPDGDSPDWDPDGDGPDDLDGDGDTDPGDQTYPPDGSISLHIPEGFRICQIHCDSYLIFPKYRLTFIGGDMILPFDQAEYDSHMIEMATLAGKPASSLASGTIRVQCDEIDKNICCFNYYEPFQVEGLPLDISLYFWVDTQARVFDISDVTFFSHHYLCDDLSSYSLLHALATIENGDQVLVKYFYFDTCDSLPPSYGGICPAFAGDVTQGEFVRGPQQRVVTDYFKLGLTCMHHGPPYLFMIVFDEPIENNYGIIVDTYDDLAHYLDVNLETISSSAITDIQYY